MSIIPHHPRLPYGVVELDNEPLAAGAKTPCNMLRNHAAIQHRLTHEL